MLATQAVRTPGAPVGLALSVDVEGRDFTANGSDIVLAYARVIDAHGTTVPHYDGRITYTVEGPASIVGGPEIGANPAECFDGIAPVMVRAGFEAGTITLRATTDDLASTTATFENIPAIADAIAASARPIYDLPRVRLDLGGEKQHVQYGWTGWYGENRVEANFALPQFGDAKVTLRTEDGAEWWRGEANVPGPLGFVAEDGVCAMGTLTLTFEGLPAGTYRLRTYHHGPSSDTDPMDPLHDKEHAADISKQAPAVCLDVIVGDQTLAAFVPQGKGRSVPKSGPTKADVTFRTDGVNPVRVTIRATDGKGSVWLNGVDLREIVN